MSYARSERIFCVPAEEVDDIVRAISHYGGWVLRYLSGMGHFIELSDNADVELRVWLKARL